MMRCSGSSEPGSESGPFTGHLAESAGLRTNGRGPRARLRAGTLSRLADVVSVSESVAVESEAVESAGRLALVVSGGATTGRGSQTLGLGGGGAAGAESPASAILRG